MKITEQDAEIVLATFAEARKAFEIGGIVEIMARFNALQLLVAEGRDPDEVTAAILDQCSGDPQHKTILGSVDWLLLQRELKVKSTAYKLALRQWAARGTIADFNLGVLDLSDDVEFWATKGGFSGPDPFIRFVAGCYLILHEKSRPRSLSSFCGEIADRLKELTGFEPVSPGRIEQEARKQWYHRGVKGSPAEKIEISIGAKIYTYSRAMAREEADITESLFQLFIVQRPPNA